LQATLSLKDIQIIPISALLGENVVRNGKYTPWYQGPTLMEYLENIDLSRDAPATSLRLPVQLVARQDGSANADFRGYLGRIESGEIHQGQKIKVLPSGHEAIVTEIQIGNDHTQKPTGTGSDKAVAGQVVAICLDRDVDISRGDMIVTDTLEHQALPNTSKERCCRYVLA
jgi:sulfate adenylyltransferase subunit 1